MVGLVGLVYKLARLVSKVVRPTTRRRQACLDSNKVLCKKVKLRPCSINSIYINSREFIISCICVTATPKAGNASTKVEQTYNLRFGVYASGLAAFIIVIIRSLFEKNVASNVLNPLGAEFNTWLGVYLFKQFAIVLVWDNVRHTHHLDCSWSSACLFMICHTLACVHFNSLFHGS